MVAPSPIASTEAWTQIELLPTSKSQRQIARNRAGAAVLWAIIYFLALHGQRVLSGSEIPTLAGLLLVVYPAIDAVASLSARRLGRDLTQLRTGLMLDGLAIIALLVATLGLHTQAVLIAFGAWALLSGLLQLTLAWRANASRRVQLPLILSGGISAIAGISFVVMAPEHVARLANVGMYALLGAVFFLVWTFANRKN